VLRDLAKRAILREALRGWRTPLEAALATVRVAARTASNAFFASLEAIASRATLRADLTVVRTEAFSTRCRCA